MDPLFDNPIYGPPRAPNAVVAARARARAAQHARTRRRAQELRNPAMVQRRAPSATFTRIAGQPNPNLPTAAELARRRRAAGRRMWEHEQQRRARAAAAPRHCTRDDGATLAHGWRGKGTGENWCNQCWCDEGGFGCTEKFCGPAPVRAPTFAGPRHGHVFTTRHGTTGYYPVHQPKHSRRAYIARVRNLQLARQAKARYHAARAATPSPPPVIKRTPEQIQEDEVRQRIMLGDSTSPADKVAQTTKNLFNIFNRDGRIARATRKAITGHEHGHIGNHLRSKRRKWFGFGRRKPKRKRRNKRRKTRRRRQRGGCGSGLCMRGGRRRTRRRK